MSDIRHIENLIARTALKDRNAFSELYENTSAKLFGVCLRVLSNRADAEEVLQEVYVRVWQKADRYAAGGYSPMTWLITLARNAAIDRVRARKAPTDDVTEMVDLADAGPTPEAETIRRSERAEIDRCLSKLDERRAGAVRGAYLEGETYAELAERFGVPLNTMRTWLHRSLGKLKECLSR